MIRAPGHGVVARAEGAADQDGELRDFGTRHRSHELGAVLGDPGLLVLAPNHEPADVLEEDQRNATLAGELDEMGALERRLAEQDAVVGQDPDRIASDVREAAHQRLAI